MNNLVEINKIFDGYEGLTRYTPPVTDTKICRLHLNENLYGPSTKCLDALKEIDIKNMYLYDLKEQDGLVSKICESFGFNKENVYIHNGSSEVIRTIFDTTLQSDDVVLLPKPCWGYYGSLAELNKAKCYYYTVAEGENSYYFNVNNINESAQEYNPKIIVITSPNMPTGNSITNEQLELVLEKNKTSLIVVDQAYWGFDGEKLNIPKFINKYPNVVFVRTFSKFYGLANERIGYCICNEALKDIFTLNLPLFKVSYSSRLVALAALEDTQYYEKIRHIIIKTRNNFIEELNKMKGVKAFRSNSNFVYIKFDDFNAAELQKILKKEEYLVRLFSNRDKIYMRVTIGDEETMNNVIRIFQRFF